MGMLLGSKDIIEALPAAKKMLQELVDVNLPKLIELLRANTIVLGVGGYKVSVSIEAKQF